ncbi:hypothetical protein PtrSN002B_009677 [Pyrenophora tritici-repentis]|uniref:Uncharacterized protein n=1 Tax=Pyrenophora tritici-repentis (strain Pt-1C-BFP) TaxID=426418 RepID=B2WIS2_PYRTR|nr:uncharacterized protein PTRG_09881 [Pyrenophora tritici-repentis Pt-1C-BFP]KAI1526994.1 hypothetical protein PtrSN001A_009654 [Pyrenophora tritici-repentis]EDU42932.1 predicted protein [Pyrenophora tritici-repentis Pt-1C-BFP]KAI1529767.1 hypothetical protein PtrSN001C_008919 [Pyrenophora tritici-repentis]KAI1536256.1 hypothetical protein PtrSN002B_009677 [Pyrenophora tritici-repentis]KAI1562943.1 hypothetical protein PtrEW4_009685 [Pyrenophora tritici-repentis]
MTATCGDNDSDDMNPALHHHHPFDHHDGLADYSRSWLSSSALLGKDDHHTLNIFSAASNAFGRTASMASIVSSCALRLLPHLYAWCQHHDGLADFAHSWLSFFALLKRIVHHTLNILLRALNAREGTYSMAIVAPLYVYHLSLCTGIWFLYRDGFTGFADIACSSSSFFALLGKMLHHTLIILFETLNIHELAKGIIGVISSRSANAKTGVAIVYASSNLSTNDHSINKVSASKAATNNPPPRPAPKRYPTASHQSNIKKLNNPPPHPQPKLYPTGPHQSSVKRPNTPPPRPQPKPYPTGPHQT